MADHDADVLELGGGHNGLTAAADLARPGSGVGLPGVRPEYVGNLP